MVPARALLLFLPLLLPACTSEDPGTSPAAANGGPQAMNQGPVGGSEALLGGELTILNPFDPGRPYFHDFGTIRYGVRVYKTFEFANTGTAPVTLMRAQGACSCTRVSRVRMVAEGQEPVQGKTNATDGMLTIPPGAVGELTIELDSTKTTANSDKLAILRVVTDAELTPFLTLELHVLAERLFETNPGNVNLGEVAQYGGAGKTIQILNRMPDKQAKLLEVVEFSPGLECSIEYINTGALPFWNLTVRLLEGAPMGGFKGQVVLSHTDDQGQGDAGRLPVDVYAMVVDSIVLNPSELSFGSVNRGKESRTYASLSTLLPGQRTRVLSATLSGPSAPYLDVEVQPLGEDASGTATQFKVVLLANAELPKGRVEAQLRLELDDAQIPVIERRVSGVVR